ncbi:hypothetical protein [Brachybacterium aquaticum]|uniref:Uncharacterized protein n=1 Tax=Brachybacterium aquaticum TaxID=1432564 RepID=A0A841ADE8_9MICO|nr:hypothetical protein [Brachybacterium aquaticum]MBB5831943.1 hypothetical protein [Brachybacterium aquaticum]
MVERDDTQGENRLAWPKLVKRVAKNLLSLFGALVLIDFTGLSDIRIFAPIEPPWITKQSAQKSTPSEPANPATPTQTIEALKAGVPKASNESTVTVTWNGVGDSVVVNWDPYEYPELYWRYMEAQLAYARASPYSARECTRDRRRVSGG